jgi:hypothetical protein
MPSKRYGASSSVSVSHINLNHIPFIEKQADFLLGRDSL